MPIHCISSAIGITSSGAKAVKISRMPVRAMVRSTGRSR
jgi:hypothetical protein